MLFFRGVGFVCLLLSGFWFVRAGEPVSLVYRYDVAGRLHAVTYPNGVSVYYSYDRNGNITGTRPDAPICYDEAAFLAALPGWPEQTVLDLIPRVECPENLR